MPAYAFVHMCTCVYLRVRLCDLCALVCVPAFAYLDYHSLYDLCAVLGAVSSTSCFVFAHCVPTPCALQSLGTRVVKVRVVGRSGARNQHGARVCVVQSGVGAHWGCRVVVRSLWSVWLGDVHYFLS